MKPRWRLSPTGMTMSAVCRYAPSRSGVATSISARSRSCADAIIGRRNARTISAFFMLLLSQVTLSASFQTRAMRALALLLALTAGCTYVSDPAQNESQINAPGNFRAGSGTIQSIAVVPNKGTKSKEPHLYRLAIHMDVGGFQTVDVEDNSFFEGEAVELTSDGRVVRVSGTTLPELLQK